MLAGIYYGAQYGGSTTAILINLPGESSSVVTALDGYPLARQGKAGLALATAAIASFFAGTVATLLLALGPALAEMALEFGPAEYFALMVLGLVASIVLAQGSLLTPIGMILLGLLLGLVGTDVNIRRPALHLRNAPARRGDRLRRRGMGVFGLAEIVRNLENEAGRGVARQVTKLLPGPVGLEAHRRPDPARDRSSAPPWVSCPGWGDARFVCRLLPREEGGADRGGSARARSKGWRRPRRPTTRARRCRSSRC